MFATGQADPGSQPLSVQYHVSDEKHTLVLTGELDMASSHALDGALTRVCTDETK